MQSSRLSLSLCLAAALAGCGGGGGGGGGGNTGGTPTPTPVPTPTATTAGCSLSQRQDWAVGQLNEWYLFPDLMASVNKASYSNLSDYVDALVAPARAQNKDRYFTYVTSIAEEEALINSGAAAGFGFRLGYDTTNRRVFVIETFDNTPAVNQSIDRGDELTSVNGQSINSLMLSGGPQAVVNALGPDTAGTSRTLGIQDLGGGLRNVTLTKSNFSIDPVSSRYGVKVFGSGADAVGYVYLRTFIIASATQDLANAFQQFKTQGITKVIVDLRYNGGGLISVGLALSDLMAANKANQISGYMTFRSSKSGENETFRFEPPSQAISGMKIAFIGTGSSASASELVMNAFPPYLGNQVALVGSNTYGKPVGQIAEDLSACDDRLRIIAFKLENADHQGEYYNGLAATMPVTCRATDDISHQFGDANEAMIATAIGWLGGGSCTAITATAKSAQSDSQRGPLTPAQPNAAQYQIPGLF